MDEEPFCDDLGHDGFVSGGLLGPAGQAALPRVHLMTGAGTLPRNPANRLEYLRYATTGEPRLTGKELIEQIPEVKKFARVSVESDEFIPTTSRRSLKRSACG